MSSATNIPISATTTDFKSAIKAAEAAISSFDRTLNKELVDAFRAADRANKDFQSGLGRIEKIMAQQAIAANKSIESIGSKFKAVGQSLSTYITLPLLAIGATAFKTYADIDALQKGLNQVSGSAKAGAVEFDKLREVAKLPGIGLAEAVQGSVRLQAVGFSADAARKAMSAFGNAIALTGGGKAELNTITTQLGQMAAKGKVLAQDLKPVIEAAPAAAGVIKKLFGTVDSEEISAKLKANGKDSAYFIDLLTSELGKLEKVSGGPKNAIENLTDSLKISAFNFFKVADASLGLTDKLNAIGSFVSGLAAGFAKLSPGAQTAILAFTGLAAAAGPVVLAIGGIIALIPALTAGAATLTAALGVGLGPIALIAAAVAGAAVIIIANWNSIKKVLTDSGIWQSVAGVVRSAFDTIKSIFQLATGVITTYWDHFGGSLGVIAQAAFHAVAVVFNTGAGILRGIFQTLGGILNLDWKQALGGLATIAKTIIAALVGLFQVAFESVGGTIAYLFNLIGANSIAKTVVGAARDGSNALQGLQNKLRGVGDEAKKTATVVAAIGSGKKAAASGATPTGTPNFLASSGPSQLQLDQDRLKNLKAEIYEGNKKGIDTSAQQAEYKALKAQIDATSNSLKTQKVAHEGVASSLTSNERILKQLTLQLKEHGAAATDDERRQVSLFKAIVAQDKIGRIDLGDKGNEIAPSKQKAISPELIGLPSASAIDAAAAIVINKIRLVNKSLADLGKKVGADEHGVPTLPYLDDLQKQLDKGIKASQKVMKQGEVMLRSGSAQLIEGIGEGLTSGGNPLKNILKGILGIISDYLIEIGTALLVAGSFEESAGAIPSPLSPFLEEAGLSSTAAGAILVGGGGIIKGLTGFAKGGVFTKPSLGIFGDNLGANMPGRAEIATPQDLMRDTFRSELQNSAFQQVRDNRKQSSTPQVIRLDINGMLKGADIHLSQQRYITISGDYNPS